MAKATSDAEAIVREYERIWNERAFSDLSDVVAESFTFTSPTADTIRGRENVESYAREVVDGFSDFEITLHELLADESLVMTESTLSGTHDGEFEGVLPTHESFEIRSMATFVVEDGTLQEERTYFDHHDFLDQLGLLDE
ncbi:ester cyclase [Halosolutus halophilus]|uniref:ester cyclase n=1 Tax=Halosolutus halophilus TaxID=1552990 RepID=UPI0022352BF2|nr:ester cyclase [Halosolutus halophilus]